MVDAPQTLTTANFATRVRSLLPAGWFPPLPGPGETEQAPVLNGMLQGIGSVLSAAWGLLSGVYAQQRLATATGGMLDVYSEDFFGDGLPREADETDDAFRVRIKAALFPILGTRSSIETALQSAWPDAWSYVEPRNANDTKGIGASDSPALGGGYGYGSQGLRYGSLNVPFQGFVTLSGTPTFVPPTAVLTAINKVKAGGFLIWVGGNASATDFGGDIL